MALVGCAECGNQVSDKATSCPKCGAPLAAQLHAASDPQNALLFADPRSGQTVSLENAAAWTLLFGPLYFAKREIWTHALLSSVLAIATAGFSWLAYPFFARSIVRKDLLAQGWIARK